MGELRREFHDHLAELQHRVVEMGNVVTRGVRSATTSLLTGDAGLADAVVDADRAIDAAYPWVEAEVFDLVARQAPVARDLRFLIATMRIAANVERCGDLVASIARRSGRLDPSALSPAARAVVEEMGAVVEREFRTAMHAYAVLDTGIASDVAALEDEVDELQRRLLRELVAGGGGPRSVESVESVVDLALVARFYERVGDHAVVIAERVRFVVSGEMDPGDRDEAGAV